MKTVRCPLCKSRKINFDFMSQKYKCSECRYVGSDVVEE